ncbi:MAG: PQQ-binding-like beta-propeller repeat protein, partial [Planctomycetota bacterium]|nr:PQQ-binding-like beta-propeller repeat protein [Planctomycetota bacterium]
MKFPAMPFFRILSIAAGFCMIAACSIFFLRADVFFFPPPPGGQPAEGAESTLGSTFPSDRDAAAKLTRAQDALAQGQFADGVQLLDRIIRSDQDTFFQPKSSPGTYRSLKREARAALGKLPQAGWESYELQFGAIAQEQLEQAATAGDLAELGAVSRQYFYTRAGLESCWLLAHAYLDRGEARKAAGFLERLNASSQAKEMFGSSLPVLLAASWISADAPEQARAVLHEMKESTRVLELAGSRQAIFGDESDAVEWLERITSIKAAPAAGANSGETAATENVDGSIPLLNSSRWQQPLLADSVQHNSKTTSPALNASQVTIPSEVPLTIGDWVVVRTGSTIVGIDFVSGKRVWEYQTLDSEEFDRFRNTSRNKSQSQVQVMGMLQQLCRRTISADSNRVYTLERHRDPLFAYESDQFVPGTNWTGAGQGYTKLLARELAKEGKLAWELGGPTEDPTSPLAGIYFLGAPLSLNDQLYVIGERQQQIALYVLDSATGKLAWWQPLVHSDIPIEMDLFRQAVGASPSHCDGIMLCPTSEGSIVAIDLLDRSLVWGLRYPRVTQMAGGRRMRSIPQNVGSIQWTDCDIVFSNGKALVTPVDSDTLYCVNVNSGQTDWSMAKAGMIYNGGVQNGTVVLIGKNTATGVNLSDGSKVWGPVSLAESADQVAAPSGQGYMNSESCFVPLSSAEVVELEIATGKVKARARCRKQSVPGNLVSYQGTTISQSERLLDCFFQFDQREKWAKEILQDRPSDPEALAAYGEILIDQGDLTGGVAKLLAALEQSPTNAQLQTLLIDTYFEGLRTDFAGHFSSADRIEKVLANGPQRAELHCLLSTGLRESGKLLPAFEHCIKVYQTAGDRAQVVQLPGGVHTVRLDRWCQEQIQGLLRQSSPADQLAIDERIQREADAASDSVEIAPLRKFLSFFGTHPSTSVVRERFVEQLVKRQQWSEVEWVLLTSATDSAVPPAAQRAVQLAELMVQAGRWDDASVAYQYLITNLPKAKVKGDLTGEQFFEQLAADSPIRKRVQQTPRSWPDGEVQTKTTNGSELASRSARLQPVLLSVRDGAGLYLSDLVVENAIQCFYDLRSRQLMGVDGEGRDRFRFPLAGNNRANFRVDVSPNNWIRACGHMLLIHVSYHLCAV